MRQFGTAQTLLNQLKNQVNSWHHLEKKLGATVKANLQNFYKKLEIIFLYALTMDIKTSIESYIWMKSVGK